MHRTRWRWCCRRCSLLWMSLVVPLTTTCDVAWDWKHFAADRSGSLRWILSLCVPRTDRPQLVCISHKSLALAEVNVLLPCQLIHGGRQVGYPSVIRDSCTKAFVQLEGIILVSLVCSQLPNHLFSQFLWQHKSQHNAQHDYLLMSEWLKYLLCVFWTNK